MSAHPYEKEVRSLLYRLVGAGWTIPRVWDGGGYVTCESRQDAIDAILSVDVSHVATIHADHGKSTLMIVLGNSPGELVCDYGVCPGVDPVVNAHADHWGA